MPSPTNISEKDDAVKDVAKLGRFDHHPDPAIDFCVEVEAIEGLRHDIRAGFEFPEALTARIERALNFTVGGDENAISAKQRLRELAALSRQEAQG